MTQDPSYGASILASFRLARARPDALAFERIRANARSSGSMAGKTASPDMHYSRDPNELLEVLGDEVFNRFGCARSYPDRNARFRRQHTAAIRRLGAEYSRRDDPAS